MLWTRRGLLKTGAALAASLALAREVKPQQRPNVLVLLNDQERYPQHWPHGKLDELMPSWRRLRQHGITFHRAYTASAMCSPSRACMLTGEYSNVNKVPKLDPEHVLPAFPQLPNIVSLMEEAGYDVAYRGKWHLSFPMGFTGGPPSTEIWTENDSTTLAQRYRAVGWDPPDAGNNAFNSPAARKTLGGGEANNDGRFTLDVLDYLDGVKQSDRPFFLFVSLVNPHDIAYFPDGYQEAGYTLEDQGVELPPNYQDAFDGKPSIQKAFRQAYDQKSPVQDPRGFVNFYAQLHQTVEPHLERILDKLDTLGLTDDTIILRTADHGEMGLSHGLREKAYSAYEETIHVPLVISNPKLFPEPRETHALYSHIDLVATLAELVGARTVGVGKSLVPVLKGAAEKVQDDVLFCFDDSFILPENTPGSHIRALRDGRWTYAVYYSQDGSQLEYELYDNESDPGQQRNVVYELREEWHRMHERLSARLDEANAAPAEFTWPSVEALGQQFGRVESLDAGQALHLGPA